MDRVHHEAGLDRGHGAVTAVDAFDLAGDQAVGDIARTGAAVFFGHGRAEQTGLSHQREEFGRIELFAIGVGDARLQLALRETVRGVADHPLFLGQLVFEIEGIVPGERHHAGHIVSSVT